MGNEQDPGGPCVASATSPQSLAIFEELQRREPIFHHPEFGTTRRDYEAMTDPDFWEVGASGRIYSRDFVLDTLQNRTPDPDEAAWLTRDFQCRQIAADNYLITYTLQQGKRVTRRATLWRRTAGGWRALYHQGTLVEAQA